MSIQDELEAPFERGQVKKREGKYEYVDIRTVVQRLNDALGYDGWSFEITDRIETDKTLIIFGQITVYGEGNNVVTRAQCGRKNIIFRKNSTTPLDLGNDWKSAHSDCIKKCASLYGVGLNLKDEGDYQSRPSNPPPPPGKETPPDSQPKPESNVSDEVNDMRQEVHDLEKSVLMLQGGARTKLRQDILNSINLPVDMNTLLDYKTKLEDILQEGKDA